MGLIGLGEVQRDGVPQARACSATPRAFENGKRPRPPEPTSLHHCCRRQDGGG